MAKEADQKGVDVPQHKRLAMGVKLDGTSMQPKGGSSGSSSQKSGSGLSHAKRK